MTTTTRPGPARDIIESIVIGVVLTGLSYAVGIWFNWISTDHLGLLEPFAVFTSYACTWLCVKERRINYPLGIVSSAAYAYLFYKADLFASTALNLYLVPTLIYGWIRWRRDTVTRPVTMVSWRMLPVYLGTSIIGYVGAVYVSQRFGGSVAWADSVILAGTVLAQLLLDNKKLETWMIWAMVNVFAIYTYGTSGLPLVAFQYVFFLFNTLIGWVNWKKSMDGSKVRHIDEMTIHYTSLDGMGGVSVKGVPTYRKEV